jgi:hypothetical protein
MVKAEAEAATEDKSNDPKNDLNKDNTSGAVL